jgi:hypothetical protein
LRRTSTLLSCALALLAALGACSNTPAAPTPSELLTKSCAGSRLDVCEPYAYAFVTTAALTPDRLRIGDLLADARLQATLRTCGAAAPATHRVRVEALAPVTTPDAGPSIRSFFLLEAEDTDRDGVIDVTVPSPFDTGLPASTPITLRFTPRIDVPVTLPDGSFTTRSCSGGSFSMPYTTGEPFTFTPDAGL